MADITNIVICPSCGAENIEGSDTCSNCMMDLRTVDVPETAQASSDSPFLHALSDIRMSKLTTVPSTATVREALGVLANEPTGAVAVMEDGRAIGIFTERDVLKRVAQRPDRLPLPVTEVMTPDPVILRESDTIATALNKMGSGGFRHMPLASAEGLLGLVTARDVLNWVMANYFDEPVQIHTKV